MGSKGDYSVKDTREIILYNTAAKHSPVKSTSQNSIRQIVT